MEAIFMKWFDFTAGARRARALRPLCTVCALLLAVALAGCGGGGSGQGGGGSGVIVGLTPLSVGLVVNQSLLFTATVSGTQSFAIASSSGAVRASNVVTITTTAAHGFMAGQVVTVANVSDISFNGIFTIAAVPSTTTLTYPQTGANSTSGGGTASNNTVRWSVNDVEGGNAMVGTITTGGLYTAPATLPPATTASITAMGAVRTSNVVTITTTAAHTFMVGQVVLISGVTDTTFNGTFLVNGVPSSTTFTYGVAAANATSGNGMVSSTAVRVKATSVADSTATATAVISIDSGISLQVSPPSATLGTSESLQFVATVFGSSNQAVNWFVNQIAGGDSTVGTISATGLYTAPATPPNVGTATITATGAVRASNVVTITTAAAHGFVVGQTVTITGVTDSTFNGTFAVFSVPTTTTFTIIQASANAMSGNGTATTSSIPVTVRATSAVDSSRSATANVLVVTAADPTLTSISPTAAAQGSVFEDVFLTGTNFIATTEVLVNGTALLGQTFVTSSTLIRARIPATLLISPGTLPVAVRRQGGVPTAAQTLTVMTVRPALVGASPDSGPQGGAPFDFNVNGGFFGTNLDPTVDFEFNGGARAATVTTNVGRQASITIGGADLANAGLFAVGVRNTPDPTLPTLPTLFSATNLAVQPNQAPTIAPGSPLSVGTLPSSVAINTATGVAVVANRGSNDLTLIDIGDGSMPPAALPGTIAVGPSPTGVAVDEINNVALVANNTPGMPSGSISVVDLASGTVTSTITTNIGATPFSVGVNSLTGLAVVVYQNSNRADIIDLTLNPPAVVSTATVSTGGNPQVAIEPRLNWAVVTPGGAGTLAIVNLARRNVASIPAAPGGATRNGGVSTITTASTHTLQQGQVVLIEGVADASFNGIFTVATVPSGTSFTYVQPTAPNVAGSGGGTATSTPPVATVGIGANTRGVAINSVTQRAILADPTTSGPSIFNLFDQVVTNVPLGEMGAAAAAFNPFTDVAVTVNTNLSQATIIDPRTPGRMFMSPVTVGAGARAVAIDPGTNLALVVNETDGKVTVIQLSDPATAPIRPLHIAHISLPLARQIAPGITLSSGSDLPLTIIGKGFSSGSEVRLDGVSIGMPPIVTDRMLTINVPSTMLAGPRRYVVDVVESGMQSNVLDLTVAQPVDLTSAGCAIPAPAAVAIDGQRDLAIVANSNCDSVALIDMNTGAILNTIAVGDNPQGVAVSSGLGRAVVTNRTSGTASVIDLTQMTPTVASTVTTGAEPLGVAISENSGQALVANAASGTVTVFDVVTATSVGNVTVDVRPVAVAVEPVRNRALVVHAAQNTAAVLDLNSLSIVGRVSSVQLPTAAAFDPASGLFIANSSLGNQLVFINPDTVQATVVRSGINPTSIALNYRSSTLVTVNTASGTISVMDLLQNRVRSVLSLSLAPQFAIAIHPRSNVAVLVDSANHRVLLMPLPR
jgi:DNA-binding beta-propeller fold protein YncE